MTYRPYGNGRPGQASSEPSDPWARFGTAEASKVRQRISYRLLRDTHDSRRMILATDYLETGKPVRSIPYAIGDAERVIAARVLSMPRRQSDDAFLPRGAIGRDGVSALLGSGFAVQGPAGIPLRLGTPVTGADRWTADAQGNQTFRLVEAAQSLLVDAGGPWLLDGDTLHPVLTSLDPQDAIDLALAGPLDPANSARVRAHLMARNPELDPSSAPTAVVTKHRRGKPTPVMTLDRADGSNMPIASVHAEYDGVPVGGLGQDGTVRSYDPESGILSVILRDAQAEQDIVAAGGQHGYEMFAEPETWYAPHAGQGEDEATLDVEAALHDARVRPAMEEDGWTVREGTRWNLSTHAVGRIELKLATDAAGSGGHLLEVVGDGRTVEFIDALTAIARTIPIDADALEVADILSSHVRGTDAAVRSDDGRVWIMPAERFTSLVSATHRLLCAPRGPAGAITVDAYSMADLAAVSRDIGLTAPDSLMRLFDAMRSGDTPRAAWPACFAGERDEGQLAAASWMRLLFETGFGGILADDVGYGKTVEIGLHVANLWEEGLLPDGALIPVPNNAVKGWSEKLAHLFPGLPVVVWHGSRRPDVAQDAIVITSHDLVKRAGCPLNERRWTLVALDEAQDAKKPNGGLAIAIAGIEADQKIPVTATPIENGLEDLWSLMNIANEGVLGKLPAFRKAIVDPIMTKADVVQANRLNAICAPFMMQRIDAKRPRPTVTDIVVHMSQDQQDSHDALIGQTRKKLETRIAEAAKRGDCPKSLAMSVLLSMTRVRQLGCSPLLMPGGVNGPVDAYAVSPRTRAIVDAAVARIADGKRILMFSSWTGHLDILAMALRSAGMRCAQYDGRMGVKDKAAAEAAFIAHDCDVLLMTTKSGGRSLDFNEADAVFLCDAWWNPKVEDQAIGRATRRGQTKTIEVLRFSSDNPVEKKIAEVNRRKDRTSQLMTPGQVVESCDGMTIEDVQDMLVTFAETKAGLAMAA